MGRSSVKQSVGRKPRRRQLFDQRPRTPASLPKPTDRNRLSVPEKLIFNFEKLLSIYRRRKEKINALEECSRLIRRDGNDDALTLLEELPPAWADHAIASIYALLMSTKRRKRLGAYFTPPHLVAHLLSRLKDCGMDPIKHRLRDPAAGGAAFLVPLARIKVAAWKATGVPNRIIVNRLKRHLVGREIETGLAQVANLLVRRMLTHEFLIPLKLTKKLSLIKVGDSLIKSAGINDQIDHEVGNPPFLRLAGSDKRSRRSIFKEITVGRANLYTLFVRRALEEAPIGGLVGYVIPASFLGGPEFEAFRRHVLQISEILVIDLVEKRSDVFVDAIQDACFVVFRRRKAVRLHPRPLYAAVRNSATEAAPYWRCGRRKTRPVVRLVPLGIGQDVGRGSLRRRSPVRIFGWS